MIFNEIPDFMSYVYFLIFSFLFVHEMPADVSISLLSFPSFSLVFQDC